MVDETENGNIFKILQGGKSPTSTDPDISGIPQNAYVITDINNCEHFAEGFLLFTSQHIAIMRDTGAGALPVLVMPLDKVFSAELLEDDSEELPF